MAKDNFGDEYTNIYAVKRSQVLVHLTLISINGKGRKSTYIYCSTKKSSNVLY